LVSGASIETTLELWASSLRDAKARIRPLFTQDRVAASASQFLDGLLGPERRKTGWMRAEAAGDPGPWRQQAILGRGRWEADALRDIVRDYALETLADPDAVLVIDETGFLKQGKASCGVGRQYTGSAGKITNCQIGVFAAYASRHGHALIDRALYLPKAWTDDPARLAAAHVPPEVGFATKPRLAGRMVERAIAAGVPFAWVAGDSVYGVGEIELALRRAGKGYVLGVNATQPFNSWIGKPVVAGTAEEIAQGLDPAAWRRLSAGEGTKGPRLSDWAYFELADLDADEYRAGATGLWTRGLLIRRSPADGSCAYLHHLVPGRDHDRDAGRRRGAALGHRGRLRDRQERTRPRPQRDPVVARLASPRLAGDAGLRHPGGHPLPGQCAAPKNADQAGPDAPDLIHWSVQEIRRIAVRLAQRRIQPAHVIAWSLWRPAHQAAAQRSHMKRKVQL
jgi:SRSO17 transposase